MKYKVMDVSNDQKIAVSGMCRDDVVCGGTTDSVIVELFDDAA
jgi:hypothetical protein